MNKYIKTLTAVMIGTILLSLTFYKSKQNILVATNKKNVSEVTEENKKINLNKLKISLPANWTKRGNEHEMFFENEKKQVVGGISVMGYYGHYGTCLPNHSKTISSKNINTKLGKGKLFTVELSNPAASNNHKSWNEVHAIIPIKQNDRVYDIWVNVKKDILMKILKNIDK